MLFSNWLKSLGTHRHLARRLKRSDNLSGLSLSRFVISHQSTELLESRKMLTAPDIISDGGGAMASVNADENQTAVTTVVATDADMGDTLTYSISGGVDSALFFVHPTSGALTLLTAPDFEVPTDINADGIYEVEVTVTDLGFETDMQALSVTVTDVNEAPVIISGSGAVASVIMDENQATITQWKASDGDAGDKLTFSLTGIIDDALFSIDPMTGDLAFVTAPNFEVPTDAGANNQYQLQITVTDLGSLTDVQDVTITITDVNEAPEITSDGAGPTASVPTAENQTAVTTVAASDVDAGDNQTFSITGGADATLFDIDSKTGALTFQAAPNFESPADADTDNNYEVQVTVTDIGSLTDIQDITVPVTNVNEAPVIISGSGAVASVIMDENQATITQWKASDVDAGDKLTFSLTGVIDDILFSIDPMTGDLAFVTAPNFEVPTDAGANNQYQLQITVTDLDGLTDVQDVTITVTNVLETAPVISSNGGSPVGSTSVAENKTAVTTVTVTDPDVGDKQTYSLSGGADKSKFTIDSTTGALAFAVAPNFEVPGDADTDNKYEVQITVTDLDGLTGTQALTVTVTNVLEAAPVINSNGGSPIGSTSVNENTTAVTTVVATDTDVGDKQTYSLSGGADQSKFTIDSTTGELVFAVAPNFEVPGDADTDNKYEVQITVTDLDGLTDTQALTVTVTNVLENAPVITSDGGGATGSTSIDENTTAVTTVVATDVDVGDKQTYSLSGGADQSKFTIDSTTGALAFALAPNFEVPSDADADNKYEVQVTVTDLDGLTDTQALTITVADVPEVSASIDGKGNFTFGDGLGVNNALQFSLSGDGLTLFITDANGNPIDVGSIPGATGSGTNSVTIPFGLITGAMTVNSGLGDDTLTLDFTNGLLIPAAGLAFNGGTGGNDTLALQNVGDQYDSETFNYTNPNDGSIVLGGAMARTITYTGLDPISNTGTPADITFNLPAGGNPEAQLIDLGGGMARLIGSTFEVTDFAVPAAGGSITINLGSGNDDLTVTSVTLSATTDLIIDGQGGTDAVHLNATGGLSNVDALTVSAETIDQATAISAAGISTFTTTNALTLTNPANDFGTINASSGALVSIVDANNLTVGNVTGAGVIITADDALSITGKVDGGSQPISISANVDGAGADGLTMQPGSSIVTTNNTASAVVLSDNTLGGGTGTITLTSVSAGTAGGVVDVAAHHGAIVDGNAATNNITGFGATLSALGGVGSSVDPIETTIGRLEGAGGTGGFFVVEADDLTIGGIGGTTGVSATAGNIDVRANGSLTVQEDVATTGGNVLLQANETLGANDVLVNSGVTVSSTAGSVAIQAGDNVTLAATSILSAGTTISIVGDSGDADVGGSTINVASQLVAPAGTTLSGGDDSDLFNITYPALPTTNAGTVTISDAGGANDLVTVTGSAGPDTLFFTSQEVPFSATTDRVTRGDATSEPIFVPAGIEGLTLLGLNGNDFFHIEPSQLFPVTVNGGSPVFGGVGVPPGDTLDVDTFGNTFSFDCDVFQVNGGMPAYFPIHVRNIETLPVQPISPTSAQRFDFNYPNAAAMTGQTTTETGFTGLLPTQLYTPGGFGWNQAVTGARNLPPLTGTLTDLINDGATFAGFTTRTFTATVANGWAMATVTFGSSQEALNGIRISNADDNSILADDLGTALNEWAHQTVYVNVLDGTLDLKFEDMTGNNRRVSIAGIAVGPLDLMSMGFNTDPGALDADGVTIDNFTLANAPANTLVTVSATLGTLVGTDASSVFQGFQVLTNGAGQAAVQIKRPSVPGDAAISFTTPVGPQLGCSSIEYVRLNSHNFDFNSPVSPTFDPLTPMNLDGYVGVTNHDVYSANVGYGWLAPVQAFEGNVFNTPNAALINDGNRGTTPSTFRVDLDNGTYTVHLYMGDQADHQAISVLANGATVVDHQSIARSTLFETSFNVTVGTGQLDLTFLQNDSPFYDGHWIINGLEIRPAAVLPNTITPINVGSVFADGSTVTWLPATSTLMAGSQVTVSSSIGTITTPDANGMIPGVQVVVGMGGAIAFDLQSPVVPGVPTVTFAATDGSALTTIGNPAFLEFIAPPVPIPDRHFDFNRGFDDPTMTPTAPGYISVRPNQTTPLITGYGWVTSPNSFDSRDQLPPNAPVSLYRDGASGPSNSSSTFQFQADPGVDYDVSVIVGRYALALDQVQVTVEGTAPQIAPSSAQFNFFSTLTFMDATDLNADGLISVSFADLGGAIATGWAAVGLDVTFAVPLLAADVGTGNDQLSQADLDAVVSVATSLIGADQLPGVSVVLANLAGNRLGLTVGRTVYIDSNAAGFGWSTGLSDVDADRYDLLSAIAHELGHTLGRDHDDVGSMQPVLGLGERHLDAAFSIELADLLAGL